MIQVIPCCWGILPIRNEQKNLDSIVLDLLLSLVCSDDIARYTLFVSNG